MSYRSTHLAVQEASKSATAGGEGVLAKLTQRCLSTINTCPCLPFRLLLYPIMGPEAARTNSLPCDCKCRNAKMQYTIPKCRHTFSLSEVLTAVLRYRSNTLCSRSTLPLRTPCFLSFFLK
jgi:hypothetical protein